jgi:hypothetical protein
MNIYLDLENPWGSGFWVGGHMIQGREIGESVYEQPRNEVDGSCHNKEGSKSVEGDQTGEQGEQGEKKQGECSCTYLFSSRVHSRMLAVIE